MYLVSDNIKYLRALRGLTQKQLAEELRLTRNQVKNYESNISQPSIEALENISRYFHISIDTLVTTKIDKASYEQLQIF